MKFSSMFVLGAALLVAVMTTGFGPRPAGEPVAKPTVYNVNTQTSKVSWKAYKVTGEHFGKIGIKSGSVSFDGGKLVGGTFEMDMTSMTIEDLQGDMNGRLLGHLKSDDFFSVANHPAAKLVITKVEPKGTTAGNYLITADMTIKGITKPVQFEAFASADKTTFKATAFIKVNRVNYDIKYRSASVFSDIGDKAINDEFDLNITLEGAK
ncbi:MAG: YceI family protein [Bacteroidia bacterium]|nr:YceI family protein [Bacteroidia bacterium]